MFFEEEDALGAAADGFDADRAGPGVSVDEITVLDGRAEDVEESFAQAIACRAQRDLSRAGEPPAAIFSGDYAHVPRFSFTLLRPFCSVVAIPIRGGLPCGEVRRHARDRRRARRRR